MYNVIIYLIQVGVAIASLFSDKVRKMWRGEQESFRILREKINPADRYIWFHAASLGEFEQGRPLIHLWFCRYDRYCPANIIHFAHPFPRSGRFSV